MTHPGDSVPCKLDISGVTPLEWIVEDAGDGTYRDHAYWLHPVIEK